MAANTTCTRANTLIVGRNTEGKWLLNRRSGGGDDWRSPQAFGGQCNVQGLPWAGTPELQWLKLPVSLDIRTCQQQDVAEPNLCLMTGV